MRNSSSSEAWAETRKRSADGPPAAAGRLRNLRERAVQSVGSSVPELVRTSGRCSRSSPSIHR